MAKVYPMEVNPERNQAQEARGDLGLLKWAEALLSPEEIKAAVERGQMDHAERLEKLTGSAMAEEKVEKKAEKSMAAHVYTIEEVAEILKCHPETVRREIRDGRLKAAKVGRDYRISRLQLDTYWKSQGGGELFKDDDEGQQEGQDQGARNTELSNAAKAPDLMSREDKIALMLELRKGGMEYQQIAEEMDKRGITTSRGGRWHKGTVHAMIKKYLRPRQDG